MADEKKGSTPHLPPVSATPAGGNVRRQWWNIGELCRRSQRLGRKRPRIATRGLPQRPSRRNETPEVALGSDKSLISLGFVIGLSCPNNQVEDQAPNQ